MQKRWCVFLALVASATLQAQTSSAPPSVDELGKAYVRRISVGGTLSFLGLPFIPNKTSAVVTDTPAIDAIYGTTGASQRLGYGGVVQIAVTGRLAVAANLLLYRVGYIQDSDILEGTLVPNLPDTRRRTVLHEDTRARVYELPVVIRWYNKDRRLPGPRWFLEGGAALRRVTNIRTSVTTAINDADPVCCTFAPTAPAHRQVRGIVGGFGVQLIDPIGIRVVPEVRYTRWNGDLFNSNSTITQKNQIEVLFSLTF